MQTPVTINIHIRDETEPTARLVESGAGDFVSVGLGGPAVFVSTRAQCDKIIEAFLAARDMLPEDQDTSRQQDGGEQA